VRSGCTCNAHQRDLRHVPKPRIGSIESGDCLSVSYLSLLDDQARADRYYLIGLGTPELQPCHVAQPILRSIGSFSKGAECLPPN
jgi:hypothetical protein